MIVAHLDGDEIAFLAAYMCEDVDDEYTLYGRLSVMIQQLIDLVEGDDHEIYLGCKRKDIFRRRILPAYKAHRDKKKSPKWLDHARRYLLAFEGAKWPHPRLEADDLIGLAITQKDGNTHIAVTQDKDIRSVPGLSINPRKPHLGIIDTGLDEALHNLMIQVLSGDSADGYKGCPGIGLKKAIKLLDDTTHRGWQKIYKAYLKKGLTRKDLHINYMCARILRRNNGKKNQ